jgi:hypothetical protein
MGRHWRRGVIAAVAAALGAACSAGAYAEAKKEPAAKAKRQDPVEAQRAIEAATKMLRAGKPDQAVQSLSATLAGGNLPPAVMAKALYLRGVAHRQLKKPAQALSDLTLALWLRGGLGGEEREDARKQRIETYADAGLTETGQALVASAAQPAPAKTAGNNWLSNVFGSPAPAAPPPKAATAGTERIETAAVPRSAPTGGWASKTEVQPERVASPAPAQARRAAPAPPPAREEETPSAQIDGRFQVQLTPPVRTKAEAVALAAKARREHAGMLGEAEIDRTVLGNMGSFYRVRFGPFASAQQSQEVCAKLKGSGLDCLPVGD